MHAAFFYTNTHIIICITITSAIYMHSVHVLNFWYVCVCVCIAVYVCLYKYSSNKNTLVHAHSFNIMFFFTRVLLRT